MKDLILSWTENVHNYGYYKEVRDNLGCIHFENDIADFESEAEYNREMTAQIAFEDKHIRKWGKLWKNTIVLKN